MFAAGALATATVLSLTAGAHAAIITPIEATAPSSDPYGRPIQLINGSRLSAPVTEQNASTVTHSTGNYTGGGLIVNAPTGTVTLDLGAAYDLSRIYLWNFAYDNTLNDGNGPIINRATQGITIKTSLDNTNFATNSAVTLAKPTSNPTLGESFTLTALNVRYVQLDLTSNYGHPSTISLGEVRFGGEAAVVPEPSTLLSLAGGVGMLGLIRRRRSA
jgi:hypothetical protein